MGSRWVARGGLDIEVIRLDGRQVIRATRHRTLLGYFASVPELARELAGRGLTMGDLVEVLPTARRHPVG